MLNHQLCCLGSDLAHLTHGNLHSLLRNIVMRLFEIVVRLFESGTTDELLNVIRDVPQFEWGNDTFYDSLADLNIVWEKQRRRGQPWPLQW
jgi:hypothetical protein